MVERRPLLVVFLTALALRLIYVWQISDLPWFDVPLVDGANYMKTAQLIVSGDWLAGRQPFWQPPLYPYFLALLVAVFGPRLGLVYVVQAAIGALSCLLTACIGRRVFGARAGLAAGLIMACWGPLIHFDAQPLIPVLHIVLMVAGIDMLLAAGGIPEPAPSPRRAAASAGLLWGLSAVATPNLLVAAPLAAVWLARVAGRCAAGEGAAQTGDRRRARLLAGLFVASLALPVMAVSARNVIVAGEWILVSSNGGINFFIGNNPDYERTVHIRPGGEFERLAQEPENLGLVTARQRSRYFAQRAIDFLTGYPREAARLYARKIADLAAGREIPRNEEIYAYREHSSLLALLVFRFGLALPFGLLAPLALAGAVARPSGEGEGGLAGRILLIGIAASYALSILIFFPADRYRLPLVPVIALFAGRLLGGGLSLRPRARVVAALLCGLVLFNLDAARATEGWPEEQALNRAYALRAKGRPDEARAEYRRAIVINPRRIDPHNALAVMAAREGRWEEAIAHYRNLLDIDPAFVQVRRELGEAYGALGRSAEAREEWLIAVHLAPGDGLSLADLCLSYAGEGMGPAAEPYCQAAVRSRPDLPETHFALGLLSLALKRDEAARHELREAARLFPEGSPGHARARKLLGKLGD